MKYFFILLFFTLVACDSEETNECNCKGKFISYENQYYYIDNLKIDCVTQRPNEIDQYIGNGYFVECAVIDY